QNHKTRSVFVHEFGRVLLLRRSHPAFHTRPKVPNQTRLLEFDRAEFHVWSQLVPCFSKKLRGWKKSASGRRDEKRDHEVDRRGDSCVSFQKLRLIDQVSCEQ